MDTKFEIWKNKSTYKHKRGVRLNLAVVPQVAKYDLVHWEVA